MSHSAKRALGALVSGLLFGLGLVVSGMTRPAKVLGFLDPLGDWDPSLALVMVGAIGVYALAYRWARGRSAPLAADQFAIPPRRAVDRRLVLGAAVFGVGWGIAGYCPGPSVVALASGSAGTLVFVAALLAGTRLAAELERRHLVAEANASPSGPSHAELSASPLRAASR